MKFCESIIYDRGLTGTEIDNLLAYLNDKRSN